MHQIDAISDCNLIGILENILILVEIYINIVGFYSHNILTESMNIWYKV